MKVLIVASRYYPNVLGGGEISTQILAEGLAVRGHKIVVASLSPQNRYELTDLNGVRVHYLPLKNVYPIPVRGKRHPAFARAMWHAVDSYNPFMAGSLGRILDREHPDVVNTHSIDGFSVSIWRAIKKRDLPLVHTLRSHYLLCPGANMYRSGRNCAGPCAMCRVYTGAGRRLSRLVDVVTGISGYVLDVHERCGCFPGVDKMVVYNTSGVEPEPDPPPHIPNRTLRFGYIGRLHPTKGVDLLIRSFLELPAGGAELLVAGNGDPDYERELRQTAGTRKGIRWLGHVMPAKLLEQIDVLVVPSVWGEPAGRVVLESLSYHVPVIGSCRGGIPEQMGDGTGWVFDPDEPGALARAMKQAVNLNGELGAMRKRAGERARQFSSGAMLDGYLRAYSCAIDKDGKETEAC